MKFTLKKTLKATMLITTAMLGLVSTVAVAKEGLLDGKLHYDNGNYRKAAQIFKEYAEQGNDLAQYQLGTMYYEGKGVAQDYRQAAKWWKKAAEQGEPFSQFYLGYMYEQGQGVAQDYRQAAKWYQKAAEQGDAQAQGFLGVLYYNGQGVKRNINMAMKWTEKACNNGYQVACDRLRK